MSQHNHMQCDRIYETYTHIEGQIWEHTFRYFHIRDQTEGRIEEQVVYQVRNQALEAKWETGIKDCGEPQEGADD